MNFYIINIHTFAGADKSKIQYLLKSITESKYIIVTTETIETPIASFESKEALSEWSFNNPSDWVGDETGIEEDEIDNLEYIQGI